MSHYVYVPSGREPQLQIHELDPQTGRLALINEVKLRSSGSAMCTDKLKKYLYVTVRDGSDIVVVTFQIDHTNGGLSRIAELDLEGHHPWYLSTDRTGRFLLAAYYSDGLVTVHPIGEDGAAHGPVVDRHETERFAHWVATDPTNQFAFVPHVATANTIYQFRFDESTGKLSPNGQAMPSPGQGPRHMAFHPTLDIVYADNEQECSVSVYKLDTSNGTLKILQTVSTLPEEGFEGAKSNAQLHLHPDARAVYASNRGPDSIAMFSIDPHSGTITSMGQQTAQKVPRSFGIDEDGNYLVSGADQSNILTSFRIDRRGVLEVVEEYNIGASCAWVLPVKIG